MSVFRLTGVAVAVGDKPWASKDGRSGVIPSASIQMGDFVVTEVTLADNMVSQVGKGQLVDLVCNVEANGGFTRSTAISFWPESKPVDSLASVGAKH